MGDEGWHAVSARWAEYQRLHREGAAYSALVRLGEIENWLTHRGSGGAEAEKWQALLRDVQLSDQDLKEARSGALDNLGRLTRMISVGDSFSYEEVLWAITLRVQLQLFSDFLESRGLAHELDVAGVDQDLLELSRSKENASTFRSAQNAAKTNWGIALRTRWLE